MEFLTPKGTTVVQGIPIGKLNNLDHRVSVLENTPATGLPSQGGNAGKFLKTDGTNPSWASVPGGGDMLASTYDPATIAEQVVGLTATQTLTNKTLTSPKINENVALTTTATKLNLLTSAAGTTGTTSTNIVFSTSPTLVTPVLGVASATTVNKVALTAPATGSTLTIDDGFTLHATGNVTALSGSHTGTSSGTNTGDQTNITGNAATVTTNANLTGVITSVGNATSIASQTGTGTKFVVDTTPTLVTPVLGVATATSINKMAITAPATSSTLAVADGKTATISNTLTLTGTDTSSVAFGAGGTVAYQAVTMASVIHGSTAGTARPSGYVLVFWVGSVEPTNATNNDVWVNTA